MSFEYKIEIRGCSTDISARVKSETIDNLSRTREYRYEPREKAAIDHVIRRFFGANAFLKRSCGDDIRGSIVKPDGQGGLVCWPGTFEIEVEKI